MAKKRLKDLNQFDSSVNKMIVSNNPLTQGKFIKSYNEKRNKEIKTGFSLLDKKEKEGKLSKEEELILNEVLGEEIAEVELEEQLAKQAELEAEQEKYEPKDAEDVLLQENLNENEYKSIKEKKARIEELEKKTFFGRLSSSFDDYWNNLSIGHEKDDYKVTTGVKKITNAITSVPAGIQAFMDASISGLFKDFTLSDNEEIELNSLKDEKYKLKAPIVLNENKTKTQPLIKELQELIPSYKKTALQKFDEAGHEWNENVDKSKSDASLNATKDERILQRALTLLEHKDEREKDYLERNTGLKGMFDGLGNQSEEYASMGLISANDEAVYNSILKKMEQKKPLSVPEEKFRQAMSLFKKSKSVKSESTAYNLADDSRQSIVMMEETLVTQALMNGIAPGSGLATLASKTGKAWKGMNTLQKIAAVGKNVASLETQVALSPSTYRMMNEKQNEAIQMITDSEGNEKWLVLDSDKINEVKSIDRALKNEKIKINNLLSKENLSTEEKLQLAKSQRTTKLLSENRNELVDEKGNLRNKQISDRDAIIHGVTENTKEIASEVFVGAAFEKFVPAIGSALKRVDDKAFKIGEKESVKKLSKGLSKHSDFITQKYDNFIRTANNTLVESNQLGLLSKALANHTGAAKMMHSLPGEYIEEIAVNLTPSYLRDYKEQTDELFNFSTDAQGKKVDSIFDSQAFDWHSQVIAQTALISGLFGTVGQIKHQSDMFFNKDKKLQYEENLKNRKLLKEKYYNIDNAMSDAQLAQDITMSTMGTIFNIKDYNSRIAELRDKKTNHNDGLTQEERNKKADIMERNSFYNIAIQSINTGTNKDLRKSLNRLSRNEKVSEETRKNALLGLNKLSQLEDISEQHKNKLNYSSILDLAVRDNLNNETINDLDNQIEEVRKKANTQIDIFNKMNNISDSIFTVDDILMKIESEEEQGEYNNWLARLRQENIPEVNKYLELVLNRDILKHENYEVSKQLRYELNPNNQESIRTRELDKIKKQAVRNVNIDNIEQTKTEIVEKGIETPDVIQEINNKAIESTDNVVPEFIAENNETQHDVNLSNEYEEQLNLTENKDDLQPSGASLSDFDELTPEEKAVFSSMRGLPAPITRNIEDENQNTIVKNLERIISNDIKNNPTMIFEGLTSKLFDMVGGIKLDRHFDLIAEAWNNVSKDKITNNEKNNIYKKIFGSIEDIGYKDALNNSQESNPVVETKAVESSLEPKIEKLNPVTNAIEVVKNIGRKFAKIGIKAGFLGLNYDDIDGEKKTNSNNVNQNALHFIDPRNFNVGDNVELVFQYDYLLNPENPITIWYDIDDNPRKETVNVRRFMEILFPGNSYDTLSILLQSNPQELLKNENFLKSIPVGIKNNGQFNTEDDVITGGLNDYFWMNKSNLALINDNVAEQEVRIQENRRINLETRKQILNNGSVTVKVAEKTPGQHNTLLKDESGVSKEFQSIFDAHKQVEGIDENTHKEEVKKQTAIGVIQNKSINKSDGTAITVNGKEVKTDNIINYSEFLRDLKNRDDKAEGKIVYVVQNGVNTKGESLYIIHNVINNHETKKDAFKIQMEILFQISKYRKILDGTEKNFTISELEKAQKIRDNIKKKFGLDISSSEVVNKLFSFYPEKNKSSNPGSNNYRQDYKLRIAGLEIAKKGVPNLLKYNSVTEFENDFVLGNIESITYDDIVYSNLHTNFIYTPVTNTKGETIWTSEVQPVIIYTTNHIQDMKEQENVDINKEKENIKTKINFIETKILPELETEEDKQEVLEEIDSLKQELNTLEQSNDTPVFNQSETEVKEFDDTDIAQIVENLVYIGLGNMDMTQPINKQNIYNSIVKEYNKLIEKFKNENKNQEVQFLEERKDEILGIGYYDNSIREIVDVLLKLDTNEDINESDLIGENVKNQSKESYEQTMSLSTKVKILLSGIKSSNSNNNENFGGLDTLMNLGDAIYSLQDLMSELENNTLEDLKKLIKAKIELNKNEFSFYNQLLERLENIEKIDSSILNQILYNLYQPKVKMSFILFNKTKDGSYKMELMDANSKNPLFIKRNNWNESFKNSPLIDKYNEGFFKLNQEGLKKYEELFDELQKNPSKESLNNYLRFVGINLNDKLLEDVFDVTNINNELYNNLLFNTKGVINNINNNINRFKQVETLNSNIKELNQESYSRIVNKIFNTKELLTDKKLNEEIQKVKNIEPGIVKPLELAFSNNVVEDKFTQRGINTLTFDNSIINDLIKVDNNLSFIPGNMMYLGGKMINIFEQPKPISNTLKSLKSSNNTLMNDLLNSQTSQDNFVLNLINENPELKNYIDVIMVGLEALKQRGDASSDSNSITILSSKDAFITLFNMFANNEGEFKNEKLNNLGLKLRKGLINFPTISDSSQLPLFKTILLDIQKNNVINNNLDEDTMNIMINHLLKGDLLRAGAFLQNGTTTNIKGYDAGAIHITGMSSLNTVAVDFEYTKSNGEIVKTKRTLIEVFRNNPEYHTKEGVEQFIEKYKNDITNEINRNIQYEVNQFITEDGKDGFFITNDIYTDKLNFIDDTYLETKKDVVGIEQARLIAFDYVINNFIQQKEIQTVFAGDIANYFKDNMVKDMVNGRSVTTTENIIDYYYKEHKEKINEMINKKEFDVLFNLFPQLKYSSEFITYDISHEEQYQEVMIPAAQMKMKKVFEDVSNNLSKRLKELISPGNQFPNSKGNRIYKQIMLQDVENASEVLDHLIKLNHPEKYDTIIDDVKKFKLLDNIYENNRNTLQKKEHEELFKKLKNELPKIAGFLKTASTDAQEYVSWKDNLNQLLDQGRLMEDEYQHLIKKLTQQEKDLDELGYIKEENKLTDKENRMAMMQPSKPLYSGQHFVDFGELKAQRYVYIKSSSFAITPEMAAFFPKLNYLRKAINKLQEGSENTTVRISYDSANKVGAVKNAMSISDLFKDNLDMDKLNNSTIELDRKNFYIQQDKPFEGNKYGDKGKDMQKTRATQFEKNILGDGINKITEKIFPNMFDFELLNEAQIELSQDNKISGVDLDKLYKLFYEKEQKIVKEQLFRELGITNYKDIANKDYKVMENLINIVNKRLSNKQDKRFLELVYTVKEKEYKGRKFTAKEIEELELTKNTAEPKVPLFMTPNSRKFESVFSSIINNNSVNLKLPGGASPVASQQNFDFKGFDDFDLDKLKKQGLVTTPNFDHKVGLKATTSENGELQYAQVFLPNRFRIYNEETGKNELINLKEFVNEQGQIDFEKLPKELLSMFSFRIPTSSHQSGVVIEIVGFLPDNMGDLMIVPKDHTVQIGEDYDIDIRYFYNYHYIKTNDGKLKKLEYSDIPDLEKSLSELKTELEEYKKQLFNDYYDTKTDVNKPLSKFKFIKNNQWRNNKEILLEIAILQDSLDNYNEDKLLHSIFQEQYDFEPIASKEEMQNKIDELFSKLIPKETVSERNKELINEYYNILNDLKEAYRNEKSGLKNSYYKYGGALQIEKNKKRVLENNIISIYKSVFSSNDNKVQDLINKTLSTDFAENTASYMNNNLSNGQDNIFNIYSPLTQAKIMALGADGKTGIGVHSNFVTQNSLLQQFANIDSNNNSDVKFVKYYDNETNEPVFYNIQLGTMVFDGHLGRIYSKNGFRISESAMESQNSATDNQKLQIMGRRNENSETINVFAILQASGLDNEGVIVNGKELSYASMFINQPIIREYVELMKKNNSLTTENKIDALKVIKKKYFEKVSKDSWAKNKSGKPIEGKFNDKLKNKIGKELTSQKLADGLKSVEYDVETQLYVLDVFIQLQKPAREYNRLQKFINIENGGVGISYFDTIELMDELISIAEGDIDITNSNKMIGDYVTIRDKEEVKELEKEGYIYLKEDKGFTYLIKPLNHYSHKIVNSIATSYNLWQSIFPYENKIIAEQIKTIMNNVPGLDKTQTKELKYKIINELKDYILSDNRTLFGRNSSVVAKDLFFDNENNTSLSKYLLELSKNPNYSYIFKLPFFKHLQYEMGTNNFPSLIKYNSNDITEISTLNIYNTLNRLVNSNKELLIKDGKKYTEADLMKDLLMYSMLASQENGAIGFRHLLPVELFDKYNVPLTIRNKTGNEGEIIQSMVYNGILKSMENYLGSNINENGVIINNGFNIKLIDNLVIKINESLNERNNTNNKVYVTSNNNGDVTFNNYSGDLVYSSFVKQYFQHNPELLQTVDYNTESIPGDESELILLLRNNGFTVEDFDNELMLEFDFETNRDFITIKNKNGKRLLYERISEIRFKQIPTLGTFGMNEYNTAQTVEKSLINKNNPKNHFQINVNMSNDVEIPTTNKLQNIIDGFIKNKGAYSDLLKILTPHVDFSKIKIVVDDEIAGEAVYLPDMNTIAIKSSVIGLSTKQYEKIIVEEILHHITHSTMKKYVKFETNPIGKDGKLKYEFVPGTPAALRTLMMVYQQGIDVIVKEQGIETVLNKIKDFSKIVEENKPNSLTTDTQDDNDIYRLTNIHEFIAGIFIKDSNFANKMSNTPYLNSGKSILEKFVEVLGKMFDTIFPGGKKDSLSVQTLASLHEFLIGESKKDSIMKPYYESQYNNQENNKVVDDAMRLVENEITEKNNEIIEENLPLDNVIDNNKKC